MHVSGACASITKDVMQFLLHNHHILIASQLLAEATSRFVGTKTHMTASCENKKKNEKNGKPAKPFWRSASVIAGCSRSPTQRPLMLKKQIAFLRRLGKTPAGSDQ